MAGEGLVLVVRTVDAIVFVGFPDLVGIASGQVFGFLDDTTIGVGVLNPVAIDRDTADAAAPVAKVPMRSFTVTVAFASVDFHVIAVAAQGNF